MTRDTNTVYSIEVHDANKLIKYNVKKEVPTKVAGRNSCALEILKREFGASKNWLALVDETKRDIDVERLRRGAPEKPIFKPSKQYIDE